MAQEYSKEQLWELYQALPEDLKEAIFSEKTGESIYDICARNGLEEKVSEVAKYTGYVMLGLLAPDELQETLKEELELKNDSAKKITLEITRFVFSPLKESLEALYKTEVKKPAASLEVKTKARQKQLKDVYREPVE